NDKLNNSYTWSATRLNNYGTCPYRFFAAYLLDLVELKPPQEGLDQLQLGSLNHRILEGTYRFIQEEGFPIAPENLNDALEILQESAEKALLRAPEEFQFRASAMWREEQKMILRRLRLLVSKDFSEDSPFKDFEGE